MSGQVDRTTPAVPLLGIANPPLIVRIVSFVGGGRLAVLVPAFLVFMPLLVVALSWLQVDKSLWSHLFDTNFFELIGNTLVLVLGVAVGVFSIGVSLAWLTSVLDFPGRKLFDLALMLPLAIPTYVLAFVFVGIFDFTGPVQTTLRQYLGPDYWFPPVRGTFGVICVMTLVLYPYVYLLARNAFQAQGRGVMEAARVLGVRPWQSFFRVALPMARPGISAGMALALMETLADFGAVSIFNYDTFTSAIYKAWYGFFDIDTAAQLASILLIFALSALLLERRTRGGKEIHQQSNSRKRIRLTGLNAWCCTLWCGIILALAFVVPVLQLISWAIEMGANEFNSRYWDLLVYSVSLAFSAASITLVFAGLLAYFSRQYSDRWIPWLTRFATLGYALPGSVLAVGIMISFSAIDNSLVEAKERFNLPYAPVLVGGVGALLLAYLVRFMAVAFGPVDTSLERIKPSVLEAGRSLGESPVGVLRRVVLPVLTPGLLSAALLVFVDVMKEMPATMLLRPFGWDTFAVRIFELTSEGEWERAAIPGLSLVAVGIIPVTLLMSRSNQIRV